MGEPFENSIVGNIMKSVGKVNKLEKDIDALIKKVQSNELTNEQIATELLKLKLRLWGY